ncbi:hypothetical protein RFI_15979, partial [Reticulomyxa filosa]
MFVLSYLMSLRATLLHGRLHYLRDKEMSLQQPRSINATTIAAASTSSTSVTVAAPMHVKVPPLIEMQKKKFAKLADDIASSELEHDPDLAKAFQEEKEIKERQQQQQQQQGVGEEKEEEDEDEDEDEDSEDEYEQKIGCCAIPSFKNEIAANYAKQIKHEIKKSGHDTPL